MTSTRLVGRAALRLVAVCAAIAGAWSLTSADAEAYDVKGGCTGTLLGMYPIKFDGIVVANLKIYYDGGRNCAATVSVPKSTLPPPDSSIPGHCCILAAGDPKFMKVWLWQTSNDDNYDSDADDSYSYFAGPVWINARDRCISAQGYVHATKFGNTRSTGFRGKYCG